uniref:Arrestin_N domain-containing protein n=1 Tax=Caenorhabditis tropicalis TaxID=1561998 RepID=A0A1I7TRM3_9PELO
MFGTAHTEWEVAEHQTRMKNREPRSHTEIAKYSSDITIVQEEICAWTGGDKMSSIPSDHQVFPFSFILPETCPPSFVRSYGQISYYVKAELDQPWKFNGTDRKAFRDMPHLDLNLVLFGNYPATQSASKDIGLIFKKDP